MVESEFDRQFREDIEKAQALSLETLALEKFRLQKLQDEKKRLQKLHKTGFTSKECVIVPEEIPRSRPRPGSFNTAEPCVPKIKPPPMVTRKSSVTTIQSSRSSLPVEDLVSFDSPPHSSTCSENDTFNSQNGKSGNEFTFDVTDRLAGDVSSENSDIDTVTVAAPSVAPGAYFNYNLQQQTSRPVPSRATLCLPFNNVGCTLTAVVSASVSNANVYNNYACFNNNFNNYATAPYRLPSSCNQNVVQLPAALQYQPSTELSVLDVIKKKDNNNLIDLTLFPDISNAISDKDDPSNNAVIQDHLNRFIVDIQDNNDNATNYVDNNNYYRNKDAANDLSSRRTDTNCCTVRTSVLEAFDPLHYSSCSSYSAENQPRVSSSASVPNNDNRNNNNNNNNNTEEEFNEEEGEIRSECSNSLYAVFDPFDYMYSPSESSQISDPIYAAVIKTPIHSPPALPVRPHNNISSPVVSTSNFYLSQKISGNKKYVKSSSIVIVRKTCAAKDPDTIAFYNMVKDLRKRFLHADLNTNPGIVISPMIQNVFMKTISVKLVVHCPSIRDAPVLFTCDVNSSVEHVVMYVTCELDAGDSNDYILKVCGVDEYLSNNTNIGHYEYVHQCIKLDQDIELKLMPITALCRSLSRTAQDDLCDDELKVEDILPNESSTVIPYDSLNIVLETMEKEMKKIESYIKDASCMNSCLQTRGVTQALKAICSLLGNIEPIEISRSLSVFLEICDNIPKIGSLQDNKNEWRKPRILDDDGDYSMVYLDDNKATYHEIELVCYHCEKIKESVEKFIDTYCRTFNTDFELETPIFEFTGMKSSSEVLDPILVHVSCLHRLGANWNHDEYLVAAQIYHGTRPVGHPVLSKLAGSSVSFYNRVVFDCWLNFDGINICLLPRESRLVFVVYGKSIAVNSDRSSPSNDGITQVELGWASIQFFNYEGILSQGSYLLLLWPPCADKRIGPAPSLGMHLYQNQPVLGIEFPCYSSHIKFTRIEKDAHSVSKKIYDFNSLDQNTQNQLLQMVEQDTYMRPLAEDREVLWEKRHYLLSKPEALPKVFLAAHSWDYACVADLHSLLNSWAPLSAVDALQLLLPCFPDIEVRKVAVQWMSPLSNDEVIDFLPQLIQALKHDTYETSALAEFLLERSLICPRVAHHLYWLLVQPLPSQLCQNANCDINNMDEKTVGNARYCRRLQLMLRILMSIAGQALRDRFLSQQILVKSLYDIAENVKITKESLRLKMLLQDLESVHDNLQETPTCLPLKLGMNVNGVQVKTCSYFPSNTLPLKISFITTENSIFPAIFKAGDDLQQDMLTLQMIRIMDKLWLKEGLDLKMVTFTCVPTGDRRGILEMVTEAETLRKIQIELGLTGSFKDRPIAEWLAKYNPSPLGYERAVENFTASCAGYSVATYILGICDRHNDNIMLKRSGHLFHIDFGKFLGDAQTFGNFKRDRTPFVLTSDMAYVINGGDKSTAKFHHFVDLCCQAFNIVRKHGNLLLNLFGLMISSGIPGVTVEAVHYVQRALLPELSNAEAAATFARMIESSLKSWFTQFNFFLHNLSQLRFNGDHNDGELLSFVPKTYSLIQEGRILSAEVYGYQKRYDPEKYYMYILKVKRENQPDPSYLFRSYKEFCEFQQKVCILFPLAKCHSLHNSSPLVGRSNIKQVAEKRRWEIQKFLNLLFQMADEISHSDLVYTFFHPLLRDQQEASIHHGKLKERKSKELASNSKFVRGQIKLTIHYQRGALIIMVHHARELPLVSNGQEPSTYVKVYLLPDPGKITKRKTKVIKRSSHPSFMEMLEYRMPIELIQYRELQATIWNHDTLQENEFLGGVSLPLQQFDLSTETTNWYTLGNVYR